MFSNGNDILDIYMNCRKEYTNFLKCILFYGMFYLDRDLKISYIENIKSDEKESLYFPLKLAGVKEREFTITDALIKDDFNVKPREAKFVIDERKITQRDLITIDFCSRRYFYEGLLEENGCYKGEFLGKTYLRIILSIKVLDDLKGRNNIKDIIKVIDQRIRKAIRLIPAWERDIRDMRAYLIKNTKSFINQTLDREYVYIKKNFINMKICTKDGKNIIISKCDSTYKKEINLKKIKDYIKYDLVNEEEIIIEEKCKYCKYREICTEIYKESVER